MSHPTNGWDIKTVTLDDEHIVEALVETSFSERRAVVSPSGKWMAYASNEFGSDNVFVRPFPDVDGGRWQVSPDGGTAPRWSPDGAALFYTKERTLMRVDVDTEPTFSVSAPALFAEVPESISYSYDVAHDGERVLLTERSADATPEIRVVLNWFDELKARVPN